MAYYPHLVNHNRRFTFFQKLQLAELFRICSRILIGKCRILIIFLIFGFLFISAVKLFQPSRNENYFLTNDFDEHLANSKENLQYAVMIDAGSSGSRVHIYVWPPHSGDPRQLLQIRMLHDELGKDVYHKINPGLSSCAKNPSSASDYMDPLLKFAVSNIPLSKHKETPLFILATAGMRMLPVETQDKIFDDLKKDIPKNYSFIFPSNHVQVIPGKEEGIYSWIAINYLMARFDHSMKSGQPITSIDLGNKITTRTRTIGMIEMGGASVQIAYEITSKYQLEMIKNSFKTDVLLKDTISEFNLGCSTHDSDHDYRLFVTTYLGLGANVARTSYVNSLISSMHINEKDKSTTVLQSKVINIFDPCLCVDSQENVTITRKSKSNNSSTNYIYILKGSGDFNQCQSKLKTLLDPKYEISKMCHINSNTSCPLTQLRHTNVPFDFSEFYGFSEFWYTTNDILGLGGSYSYSNFKDAASSYCATSWSVLQDRYKRNLYPLADQERLMHQCFKSAWVVTILHDGFNMPKTYKKYKSALTVNGEQVQWTLGALLYRTRYFPLRAIQHFHTIKHSGNITPSSINYTLFIICMIAVLICIIVYLRHLHKLVNSSNINDLQETKSNLISVEVEEPLISEK